MIPTGNAPALPSVIEWAVAGQAIAGEQVSGDLHLVQPFDGGVLVAVADGLGHGEEAAAAAIAAVEVLRRHADEPVTALVKRCHAELRRTRGVVLSLASFDVAAARLTWVGIGNVEGMLYRADGPREALVSRSGVVGFQLPPPHATVLPIAAGDMLVFATDGIHHDFAARSPLGRVPQQVADELLARYGKSTDDALVLVACYGGVRR
jgi:negative regulator of sigma-B (phosphoserine phosphatase)